MRLLSSTDLALAAALRASTLRIVERPSRMGGTYVSLEDAVGVIEVHDDLAAAAARLAPIRAVAL